MFSVSSGAISGKKKKMTEETKCVSRKECVGELIVCVCVCRARQRLDCAARCFLTCGPLLSPLTKGNKSAACLYELGSLFVRLPFRELLGYKRLLVS